MKTKMKNINAWRTFNINFK